jgi:hypothetical protein
MARPQETNGEGSYICRVAANILDKQSRTAGKGWSSISGVGQGLTTPQLKKKCYEMLYRASYLEGFPTETPEINLRIASYQYNFVKK